METTAKPINQITEGRIWKPLLMFFLPIALGTLFQQLYNTVDAVVVGRFVGKEALAAVGGSSGQIINLVVGFFVGLSSGASVIISQFYGAKDTVNLNRTLHTAVAFSVAGSIFVTILGIALAEPLLAAMNTPRELMRESSLYLKIYFGGILFVFIYNIGSAALRAVGNSKSPLYYLIVCCILNVVLDCVLIVVFHMGVAGAAIATVFSQAVSAVLVLLRLARSDDPCYRLSLKGLRIEPSFLKRLLYIGLPAGFQSAMYSLSNIIIQSALNEFGTDSVAAWTAFGKIDGLCWMVIGAMGISATTFVGQNYGARKFDRMKKSVWICMGITLLFAVLIMAVFLLFADPLFRLFTDDSAVIAVGMVMLWNMVPYYWIYVPIEILTGALRGVGDVLIPTLITCLGVCALRVIWIFVMLPAHHSIETVMFTYPLTWIVTSIAFLIYFRVRVRTWK
ncbi:MAG TPA: MATE family efflux transporter [Candidatus Limivivens intestinipullorum]|uniref:Probable multidrug resistance protein NorM n=1 Tax=Candidatus Limivivens intestinipullorum TaxID=2840858 RepID=A0A9D1ER01_9FIRM|nr:MATE family efflux transporter [Candidatus Limivivens intestinipullorum]